MFRGYHWTSLDLGFPGWWWSDRCREVGLIPFSQKSHSCMGFLEWRTWLLRVVTMWCECFFHAQAASFETYMAIFKNCCFVKGKGFPISFPFYPILDLYWIRNTWRRVSICCYFPPSTFWGTIHFWRPTIPGNTSNCLWVGCWVGPGKILITRSNPYSFLLIIFENTLLRCWIWEAHIPCHPPPVPSPATSWSSPSSTDLTMSLLCLQSPSGFSWNRDQSP